MDKTYAYLPLWFSTDSQLLKDVAQFTRQELEVACEDFSNIIGSSPDSVVYKGNIKGGPEIAVISLCIKELNWTGYLELYFQREVIKLCITSAWFVHNPFQTAGSYHFFRLSGC